MKNRICLFTVLIFTIVTITACDSNDAEEISETKVYKDPYTMTVVVNEIYDDYFTGTGYYDESYKYKIFYHYDGTYAEGDVVETSYLKLQKVSLKNYQFFTVSVNKID